MQTSSFKTFWKSASKFFRPTEQCTTWQIKSSCWVQLKKCSTPFKVWMVYYTFSNAGKLEILFMRCYALKRLCWVQFVKVFKILCVVTWNACMLFMIGYFHEKVYMALKLYKDANLPFYASIPGFLSRFCTFSRSTSNENVFWDN